MENLSEGPSFCGGFSYQLVYTNGPLKDITAPNEYKIEPVDGGRHSIQIKVNDV